MTTDNTKPPTDNEEQKIVSFADFKKDKERSQQDGSVKTPPEGFPTTEVPKQRKYIIDLLEDSIEIEGFVGLTGSFLAIGDAEGRIKFGVAAGQWLTVTDITDLDVTLEDLNDKE